MIAITYLLLLLGLVQATTVTAKEAHHVSSKHSSSVPAVGTSSAKKSNTSIINEGYAPRTVSCPSKVTSMLREAKGLSSDEKEWLKKRELLVSESLKQFMLKAWKNFTNATDTVDQLFPITNASSFNQTSSSDSRHTGKVKKHHNKAHHHHDQHENGAVHKAISLEDLRSSIPKIGIAASGGSYRAMFSGAGMLAAMDDRTRGALEHGLGGLLQSSSYLAGLSGGSWLVGTLIGNNWTSVQAIVDGMKINNSIWDLPYSLAGGNSNISNFEWLDIVKDEIDSKRAAGFPVSLSDYLGHAMAYNYFPHLSHGAANFTISDIRDLKTFQDAQMPFPLIIAESRAPDEDITFQNSTVFEFNPFEMGSWDDTLQGFTNVRYLGTNVSDGVPIHKDKCVEGYDNLGFILGTSASLFTPSDTPKISQLLTDTPLQGFLNHTLRNDTNDVAQYAPNPFKNAHFGPKNSGLTKKDALYLVDGGEDLQTIPFVPLLQKERDLDVIFALDSAADTANNWPNGSALVSTYERQFSKLGKNIAFPPVPDTKTFEEEKLNQRITFFGCNDRGLEDLSHIPPLIVYMPNAKHTFASNTSSLQVDYNEKERLDMIKNGFETATMGNLTQDPNFGGCVACAIAMRKEQSGNISLPKECDACFDKYCWKGSVAQNITEWNNATSAKLGFGLKNVTSNITWNSTTWKPFGNGTANLTAIINQNQTNFTGFADSFGSNGTFHSEDSEMNHDKKHNAATGLSTNKILGLASLLGLMMTTF